MGEQASSPGHPIAAPGTPVWPRASEPSRIGPDYKFVGHVEIRAVSQAIGADTVQVNALWFAPGARSRPHSHDAEQILYWTEGPGVVAVDGGPDVLVEAGQFVRLEAGVVHMHGAPETGPAAHVSLIATEHVNDFECPVPEAWRRYERGA